jgi:GR25 family glycosyltransferase involved in LPS biosynthesis
MNVHTYVINLDRSTARLENFRRVNGHMPEIHRFSAIEGRDADRVQLVADNVMAPELCYSDGALGCALSHIFFWEAATDSGDAITVVEDDAIIHRRFNERSDSLIRALPRDWDLVMWGWNFDSILLTEILPGVSPCLSTFNQDELRVGAEHYTALDFSPQPFRLLRCFGTIGYTVSPAGARKLRERCLPLRPLTVDFPMVNPRFENNGIDIAMNAVYPSINAYACFPPMIITKNEHAGSTVQPNAAMTP